MASREAEAALIGERDQVYIVISDHVQADVRCPSDYVWMGTLDPEVRIVRKVKDGQGESK